RPLRVRLLCWPILEWLRRLWGQIVKCLLGFWPSDPVPRERTLKYPRECATAERIITCAPPNRLPEVGSGAALHTRSTGTRNFNPADVSLGSKSVIPGCLGHVR